MLFYTFPLFILPLLFRTIANFRDFNRQKEIAESPYEEPEVRISAERGAIDIEVRKRDNDLQLVRSRVQVGVAMPERSSVLSTLVDAKVDSLLLECQPCYPRKGWPLEMKLEQV